MCGGQLPSVWSLVLAAQEGVRVLSVGRVAGAPWTLSEGAGGIGGCACGSPQVLCPSPLWCSHRCLKRPSSTLDWQCPWRLVGGVFPGSSELPVAPEAQKEKGAVRDGTGQDHPTLRPAQTLWQLEVDVLSLCPLPFVSSQLFLPHGSLFPLRGATGTEPARWGRLLDAAGGGSARLPSASRAQVALPQRLRGLPGWLLRDPGVCGRVHYKEVGCAHLAAVGLLQVGLRAPAGPASSGRPVSCQVSSNTQHKPPGW